jgi:hypothetical protein
MSVQYYSKATSRLTVAPIVRFSAPLERQPRTNTENAKRYEHQTRPTPPPIAP